MKSARIEVTVSVRVYVGEDVGEQAMPAERIPEVRDSYDMNYVAGLGPSVQARDAAGGHVLHLLANAAPVISERVRHQLREKGL